MNPNVELVLGDLIQVKVIGLNPKGTVAFAELVERISKEWRTRE